MTVQSESLLLRTREHRFFAKLHEAGMPRVPDDFSVTVLHQKIPRKILESIDLFLQVFERVTTRLSWQNATTANVPDIAKHRRSEGCFFSCWDFHLPPHRPDQAQLIECNQNGSGILFAPLVNQAFYEIFSLRCNQTMEALESPPSYSVFTEYIVHFVEKEIREFFGRIPEGLFFILDDAESLQKGKFRQELFLLRDIFRRRGWRAEVGSPEETVWDGRHLLYCGNEISFIVNRSCDFLWQTEAFSPLRSAYQKGTVYVAPNPFIYVTRGAKHLLELFSLPHRDEELGIRPEERAILSAHIPKTYVLRENNIRALAQSKESFVFKPTHGFASRGLLLNSEVGHSRLRRLLKNGKEYVAQELVPKPCLPAKAQEGYLWLDLRVWAYRGERFLISGRASLRADTVDLASPGGWMPTFAQT